MGEEESCILDKSSLRDARSRLLVFLDIRSRVDEMPDLAFSSS